MDNNRKCLVKIDGIMTADIYINVINENLEKFLLKFGLEVWIELFYFLVR